MEIQRIGAPWPAVPANNGTVVMFTTHQRLTGGSGTLVQSTLSTGGTGGVDPKRIYAVTITWLRHNKASAADGLKIYARDDTDTYRETDLGDDSYPTPTPLFGTAAPFQIPALSSGTSKRVRLVVAHLVNGFCVEYVAGPDNPEQWNGVISVEMAGAVLL